MLVLLCPAAAFAHVIVTPAQVSAGQELVFNESVPNEERTAVISVELLIPAGVADVIPTVKPGWTIDTTSSGSAGNSEISSITWTGNIPVGQRDDFTFSAQILGTSSELDWKAYQTYADGSVVHWDQKPAGSDDSTGSAGPYSVTKVVSTSSSSTAAPSENKFIFALIMSGAALLFSLFALYLKRT